VLLFVVNLQDISGGGCTAVDDVTGNALQETSPEYHDET
jgi:hypothetical protein